ncbi:MsnO8 family LLM class oxidoreductase [Streptomyces sp. N2-109]|uniref:MsnO8 family LLM class oxidoreductase n=1 Tax=Streptomyces gossypii TaxID=2883101 RepID=A0ABT2JUY9_9ACTN|nr:MsnO8 family LLM class oxidoreductase [Streptomyces gossypii]MCT2591483.1 MsnO8 family LLM class oxidoreductase [Streptomyces gossypii]
MNPLGAEASEIRETRATPEASGTSEPGRRRPWRLSVLDRSLTRAGQPPAEALRATVRFAREAEELGYHRFWVSEHHGVPGVAGSAPTVLAAAVAAATERIRIGTGGVMLPNHPPLVVAEQFGVLESLFPGRIDMGLGRSVGFTDGVRRALGVGKEAADGFEAQLAELLGYFAGGHGVRAVPGEGLRVPAFVLATGSGADIAAAHGLPLVIGALRDKTRMYAAIDRYRDGFRPSAQAAAPYVVVASSAAVAATRERAELLQIPEAWSTVVSRTRGVFAPLLPAAEVPPVHEMSERERTYFEEARQSQLYGTEDEVAASLDQLAGDSGADEILLTLNTHDPADRLESYRRLAVGEGLVSGAASGAVRRPAPAS